MSVMSMCVVNLSSNLFLVPKCLIWCAIKEKKCLCYIQDHLDNSMFLFLITEKVARAKDDNLNMHQMLDQTLLELNNM